MISPDGQIHRKGVMPAVEELTADFLCAGMGGDAPVLNVGGAADAPADGPLPCVIAIGAFDGVHRGHADLLRHAIDDARERGVAAVAVTFDPDPDEVVSAHPAPKLTSMDGRLRALTSIGVRVAVVPFTRQLAALDHVAFFEGVLAPYLDIRAIHVGSDFRLGARGASTVPIIADWGTQKGIAVTGHDLILDGDAPITATRIRSLIARGDVDSARRLLGRRPMLRGQVGPGRGQGTGMGFPTANVEVPGYAQMPADGVYAGLPRSTVRYGPPRSTPACPRCSPTRLNQLVWRRISSGSREICMTRRSPSPSTASCGPLILSNRSTRSSRPSTATLKRYVNSSAHRR